MASVRWSVLRTGTSPGDPVRRVWLLGLVPLAIAAGAAMLGNRELVHLAAWRVSEETSIASLSAPPVPSTSPAPGSPAATNDFERASLVARQVLSICAQPSTTARVRWGPPEEMRQQVLSGAVADCWPRSLLFAADASRAGLATRVWALEGNGFQGQAHTVPEVYLPDQARWVVFDVTINALARDTSGLALGLLEIRDRILDGRQGSFRFEPIAPARVDGDAASYYADRSRDVFLRRNLGLDDRDRYGALAPFARALDRLPEGSKKALSATFGRTGYVTHYHDAHNASLATAAIFARVGLGVTMVPILAVLWLVTLTAARLAYASAYVIYSMPPRGTWSFASSFESGGLAAFARPGSKQLGMRHSGAVVTSPGGGRGRVLRVRLEPGDRPMRGNHRAEMRLRATPLGSTNEYQFRVWVPPGWIERASETVIAQWHSVPDLWRGRAHVSGPLALVIAAGRWILWSARDPDAFARGQFGTGEVREREALLDLPVETERWVDWSFRIRWAFSPTGRLSVIKDGKEVVRREGPNTYDDAIGPYFKFGLYAPGGPTPGVTRTIYFDAIRARQGLREWGPEESA